MEYTVEGDSVMTKEEQLELLNVAIFGLCHTEDGIYKQHGSPSYGAVWTDEIVRAEKYVRTNLTKYRKQRRKLTEETA
jgi:hypothetical protein